MNGWSIACLATAFCIPSTLSAQVRDTLAPRAVLDSIDHHWSLGHYPEALARMAALLESPGGPAALEGIALLTGELFRTDSLAPDGREVQWSPDGRYMSYATGTGPDRQVHVIDRGSGQRRASSLAGRGLVFSPTSREAAYLG
ncbi:MAG TPA: hypothetical protein VK012_00240, partial [Gemmatimonadales bacterium]|nr:hypothetical protein [Gemmatimonadales bacterium]